MEVRLGLKLSLSNLSSFENRDRIFYSLEGKCDVSEAEFIQQDIRSDIIISDIWILLFVLS